MARLWVKAAKCNYKENDRCLEEQFINGINDYAIPSEKKNKKFMKIKTLVKYQLSTSHVCENGHGAKITDSNAQNF